MNAPFQVGISFTNKSIESIIRNSILLSPETKAALSLYIKTHDPEEIQRIGDFLGTEKTFILSFFKQRLKDGNFPEKIPILLKEMQFQFIRELRLREWSETENKEIVNTELESFFMQMA